MAPHGAPFSRGQKHVPQLTSVACPRGTWRQTLLVDGSDELVGVPEAPPARPHARPPARLYSRGFPLVMGTRTGGPIWATRTWDWGTRAHTCDSDLCIDTNKEGQGMISCGHYFAGENFGRGKIRQPWESQRVPSLTHALHCHGFRQGNVSPPSFETDFSNSITLSRK